MADEYEDRRTGGAASRDDSRTETEQDSTRKTRVIIEEELLSDLDERAYLDETIDLESLSELERQRLERTKIAQPAKDFFIKTVKVAKLNEFINARGELRKISIIGTKGSGFSIKITDSKGENILELNNAEIPKSGKYIINQKFPSIITSSTDTEVREIYDVIVTPNANTEAPDIYAGTPVHVLKQYADTTITVSPTTTQTGPVVSITTGSAGVNRKNKAGITYRSIQNNNPDTYNITCEEDSVTSGFFYVKNASFNKNLITDSVIKKVVDRCGDEGYTGQLILNPKTTRTTTVDGESVISSDLKAGMKVSLKIEKNKIVTKSLGVVDNEQETTRFDLNNTTDLFPDMQLKIRGFRQVYIVSVDCDKSITVSGKVRIKENTDVTFKYKTGSYISSVLHQNNSRGQAVVNLIGSMYVPDKSVLEFDDNDSIVSGTINFSGSGSKSVSIRSFVSYFKYGTKNVTYSLDIDNMITRIPNAYDQDVEFDRYDSSKVIDIIKQDYDVNAADKTVTITSSTRHGSTVISGRRVTYTPVTDFTGIDQLKFTVSDGTNSSLEKTIRIIVK